MAKLINTNTINNQSFLSLLKDKDVIVYEDVQGARVWVSWDGSKWILRPRTVNNDPINMVDLAMQKFYNQAYLYFLTLSPSVTFLLNKKWQFGFEYFCDEQPANVKYDKLPKNNLVLTSIHKGLRNYTSDIDELKNYAELFDTDTLPIIYRGKFSDKQLQLINKFLSTSKQDLEYVFKDINFSSFFYKLLNPNHNTSFLMKNGFQDNLERVIIRFNEKNEEMSLEILNPLYTRISAEASTEYVEIYSILLTRFIQFIQTIDVNAISIYGNDKHTLYLNLICKLYNMFMQQSSDDINKFIFSIPPFFSQDKFAVEKHRINNPVTKNWINLSKKNEYVFKILLSSMKTYKKKPIGIFTEEFLIFFNNTVDLLNNKIEKALNKTSFNYNTMLSNKQNNNNIIIDYDKSADGKLNLNNNFKNNKENNNKKKISFKEFK